MKLTDLVFWRKDRNEIEHTQSISLPGKKLQPLSPDVVKVATRIIEKLESIHLANMIVGGRNSHQILLGHAQEQSMNWRAFLHSLEPDVRSQVIEYYGNAFHEAYVNIVPEETV